jgi:hypothetical protein
MNATTTVVAPVPSLGGQNDHRGSWIPTWGMITTRFMELRRRRGLMIAMTAVIIGLPTVFLVIRLIAHAVAPKSYAVAGGYDVFTNLTAGVMFIFGFIMAAALGCTAGSIDLTEGMFRHLVVTGRSRTALYFARIPAGLAIVVSMVAVGFTIVCVVCCVAAPRTLSYDGVNVPAGLSSTAFNSYASSNPGLVICNFNYHSAGNLQVPCEYDRATKLGKIGFGKGEKGPPPGVTIKIPSKQVLQHDAVKIAKQNFTAYSQEFLSPTNGLMIRTGLWLELEAAIGFIVALGLGSLLGQRTVAVIVMLVYEVILTPLLARAHISHLINAQRGLVGLATAHLEPAALPQVFGGGNGPGNSGSVIIPETRLVAVIVIVAWVVVWTALGARRMATRDA